MEKMFIRLRMGNRRGIMTVGFDSLIFNRVDGIFVYGFMNGYDSQTPRFILHCLTLGEAKEGRVSTKPRGDRAQELPRVAIVGSKP